MLFRWKTHFAKEVEEEKLRNRCSGETGWLII